MFLFVFEIILLFLGIWMLISGRVSARLVGAPGEARGGPVRLAGFLLMLPILFEYALGNLLKLVGDAYYWYLLGSQVLLVAGVMIAASILIRRSLMAAPNLQPRDENEEVK